MLDITATSIYVLWGTSGCSLADRQTSPHHSWSSADRQM